jgi:hypothetical protein
MSQLQPVTLTFNDKEYTVDKEAGIWGLIEVIEDVITLFELAPALEKGKYPSARIFRAYAAALTYAGCKVSANEVREASDYRDMGQMAGALCAIMMMAQPGADVDLGSEKGNDQDAEKVKKKAADE